MAESPSPEQCRELIRKNGMLPHIVAHSLQVCRVALTVTDRLISGKNGLDRELIRSSALLHDITKTRSLETGEPHADTGADYLTELGFPEMGEIVRRHVLLNALDFNAPVTEAEIVNYADKRVRHDEIVSLTDRMTYIMERYGRTPALRQRLFFVWEQSCEMEKKLFRHLPFSPERILEIVKKELFQELEIFDF